MTREHPSEPTGSGLQTGGGLPHHHRIPQPLPATLDVVAVVSNPFHYRSRWDLYRAFERRTLDAGARLTAVELAYAERPHEVTQPEVTFEQSGGRVQHVQLRSAHALWHKENLLNLAISRLPSDWRYVAWVDADVTFARPDWVQECLQQLQHYSVLQMFTHWMNLRSDYGPLAPAKKSFMAAYRDGDPLPYRSYYGSREGAHPGFAWAARREAIDMLGGLLDTAILGSGDRHMAYALIGRVMASVPAGLSKGYLEALAIWQERAQALRRNIGVMAGTLLHAWHGSLADRRYHDRWKIVVKGGYDPLRDLRRDWQGLYALSDRSIYLRDEIRHYFSARHEDDPGS